MIGIDYPRPVVDHAEARRFAPSSTAVSETSMVTRHMITVAVIGAEGKSSQQFVRAALTQGWRVRAGVHQTGARVAAA